jgi:alkylation response protein AidB-like acyl-CoA dehydrogenase
MPTKSIETLVHTPLFTLTEEEQMLPEMVRKFAKSEISPQVRKMDEKQTTDAGLVSQLFNLGLMGIEIPVEYGGVGASFLSAILASWSFRPSA